MAIDNCPTTGSVTGGGLRIQGCPSSGRFASVEGLASGIMFDLRNPGTTSVAVVGLASWFCHASPPTMIPDADYQFWIKNTVNTGWRAGVAGTIAGPGGCSVGASWPLSQWTLAATSATHKAVPNGIRLGDNRITARTWVLFGANATNNDTFDIRSAQVTQRVICGRTMSDTMLGTALILAPGETRGCFIAGAPGTGNSIWANDFNQCGGPNGNATLTINPAGSGGIYITNNNAAQIGGMFNCASWGFSGDIFVAGGSGGANMIVPVQYCGQPYAPGCFFPIGCTKLCYRATDVAGNIATCEFNVCVNAYPNPTNALACQNNVQLSLDENCLITLNADMFLSGGPYKCFNDYKVEARYWTTTGTGGLIDRQPLVPKTQLNGQDIGREFKITIRDTVTGNSCWSHATVEDKIAPRLTCPPNITVSCAAGISPSVTGVPVVIENCGGASLSYRDNASKGNCQLGYSWQIILTWTAVDGSGNRATCVQLIQVGIGDLFDVTVPRNYDNLDLPMLNCDQKIIRTKDVTPHMADFPQCVDGYLLDSAFWRANPLQPDIYPNRRLPRVLGWNCIDSIGDPKFGHPSPDPVYYPAHRQWSPQNPLCWGPNTHVEWIGTGRPGGTDCFNFSVACEDIVFNLVSPPNCNAGPVGCYKIIRKWTVLDWCTGVIGGHSQIIKVGDIEGPKVLYPDSSRVNMESYSCSGRWEVPPAWLIDNCSSEIHYSVEVEQGTILGNETSGFVVINMPEGIQIGYIVASDCCGNITKKRVVLNVVDRVPPQAICRTSTVVSLNGNQSPGENIAKVCAESFDEGSYDNCAPHVFFKVIRMAELLGTNNGSNANNTVACNGINGDDNVVLTGNQVYFDDCTYFCCADIGTSVMVVFRVFDVDPGLGPVAPVRMNSTSNVLNGRFSDCMVEVQVQNKAVPTVVAPPNIVVSCSFWFDISLLTNPNDPTFGRVVTDLTLRKKVVTFDIVCHKYCERNVRTGYPGYVQTNVIPKPAPNQACDYYNLYFDTAHWDRKYELVWGFDGYVLGACGATPNISVNDLRECGQGQIQRVISTVGPNNLNVSAIQTIWVVDCDPFYVDTLTCNDARYTDLFWPNGVCTQTPVTVEGCGGDVSPDNPQLGRPTVINNADDNCALISIEYRDEIFTIEPDACFKILRHWIVIDWCQYDPFINATFGRWEKLQVIKVRDKDKPVVTCHVGDCQPATLTKGICYGPITLTAEATDNCSPLDWLLWEYKIDLFNDGKGIHGGYDLRVGSLTRRGQAAGDTVEYSHNPYANDNHNPFDASGSYPAGTHKICWFVEDGCGNVGVCCSIFEIKDCKAPTPYCLTGIITVPMPASGCITIWARDLDHGSFDNCSPKDSLKFYFDGDPNKPSITICCQDFIDKQANDELRVNVEMWVEDEEGNRDYCKTVVIIQDNLDICPNTGSFGKITGELKTRKGDLTNPVDVELYNNGNMMKQIVGGPYSFGDLKLAQTYTVKPNRNDEHLNGVSTQDITMIQKHILGKALITNPYTLIAADVNNSKSITSSDIAEIRKLILGTIPEFSKVKSWTFVPKVYQFADPLYPFDAPRDQNVSFGTSVETKDVPFVAIKMGDVTENARASNATSSTSRTKGQLNIEIDEKNLVSGESYKVNFKSSDFADITGYQFTLKFNASAINFEGIEAGVLNTNESNFGLNRLDKGIITTSWNANTATSFGKDDVLFTLVFKATKSVKLSQMFSITSDVTTAEAYNSQNEIANVKLSTRTDRGVIASEVFELYQNEPNPFAKQTVISYRLPEAGAVKLSIYDVTGKVVRVYELTGVKGLNTQNINKSDLNVSGVLYYQLDATNNTATKRMVIIE
ncbi:MAG: T9SS type A sorting domain-containing protein [Saprospiraceae bacterium]